MPARASLLCAFSPPPQTHLLAVTLPRSSGISTMTLHPRGCAVGASRCAVSLVATDKMDVSDPPPPPLSPFLVLALVPLAWGTYGPAIKTMYSLDAPPPELAFNFLNYVVSSLALVAVSAVRGPTASPATPASPASPPSCSHQPLFPKPTPAPLPPRSALPRFLLFPPSSQIFGLVR